MTATDRECLRAWARSREADSLRPVIDRYLRLVFSSALRRTGDVAQAGEVTRAVFLVLARRARKLRNKTILAGWLFQITAVACRKLQRRRRWFRSQPAPPLLPEATLWMRVAPHIDRALDRLSLRLRNAILLCAFLNVEPAGASNVLRLREHRANKRLARGLRKLARRLRRHAPWLDTSALAQACSIEGCRAPLPESLAAEIFASIEENKGKRPSLQLARRTLNALAWTRWRKRFTIGIPTAVALLIAVGSLAWYVDSLSGHSRLIAAWLVWAIKRDAKIIPGLAQPARPWPTNAAALDARAIRGASDLFQTTNIWQAHLSFSREQWKAVQPRHIGALPNFIQADGTALLRNPQAQRSGLAGALGYDFNWVHADCELGGLHFTNVAARMKGNGTWLSSLSGDKRPFKVDLNKFVKGQKLAGLDDLTFNNLVNDASFMSDALAYEFFRDAGVPAPRTAYAWMSLTVAGRWQHKPLGLYLMVEPVDESFVQARFGSRKTAVFKPVTYQLFEHLGESWSAYEKIYDVKTQATPAQQRRVIELARLVSFASDSDFNARLGEFLDLDEFARFLAGTVLLSNYDSILADGQNFYVYLDPRSNKFGFVPWDLDLAWGGFFLLGSATQRERASIWHPWVGQNRFLERVMNAAEFRRLYRERLADFHGRLFVPARLYQRIDDMAALLREPIAAESDFRLNKFEQAIGAKPLQPSRGNPHGPDRPAHQLKRFITKRAESVQQQLDGKSNGTILRRGPGG